jgi:quercetin dioxygenase-like cupin family protein
MRVVRSKLWWALVAVVPAVSLFVGKVVATPQGGVSTTILAKSVFNEIDIKAHALPADVWQTRLKTQGQSDVYVVSNKFAAVDTGTGAIATTGWHSHPGPSMIHVVRGTVTNYSGDDPTCTGKPYAAGEGFIDTGSDVHMLRNEGSVEAETIAVQILPKDAGRRIDVQDPGNCRF